MTYSYFNQFYIDTLKSKSPALPQVTYSEAEPGYLNTTKSNLLGVNGKTFAFIDSRLKWLSHFINLDFIKRPANEKTAFKVSVVDQIDTSGNANPNAVVEATPDPTRTDGAAAGVYVGSTEGSNYALSTFSVRGKDPVAQWVWMHELGHVMGLTHPDDIGNNPNFTNDVTIMSYARDRNQEYRTFFQRQDIENLQSIWGKRNDIDAVSGIRKDGWLVGTGEADVLIGTTKDDIIYGGNAGADYLKGGPGADTFVLEKNGRSKGVFADQIVDFNINEDKIAVYGKYNENSLKVRRFGAYAYVDYKAKPIAVIDNFTSKGDDVMISTNVLSI